MLSSSSATFSTSSWENWPERSSDACSGVQAKKSSSYAVALRGMAQAPKGSASQIYTRSWRQPHGGPRAAPFGVDDGQSDEADFAGLPIERPPRRAGRQ